MQQTPNPVKTLPSEAAEDAGLDEPFPSNWRRRLLQRNGLHSSSNRRSSIIKATSARYEDLTLNGRGGERESSSVYG